MSDLLFRSRHTPVAWKLYLLGNYICLEIIFAWKLHLLGNYICLEIIFAWKLHSLRNYILLEITFAWKLHLLGNYICLQITFAGKLHLLANYICLQIIFACKLYRSFSLTSRDVKLRFFFSVYFSVILVYVLHRAGKNIPRAKIWERQSVR